MANASGREWRWGFPRRLSQAACSCEGGDGDDGELDRGVTALARIRQLTGFHGPKASSAGNVEIPPLPMKRSALSRSIVLAGLSIALALAALVVFVVRGFDAPTEKVPPGHESLALALDRALQRSGRAGTPGLAVRPLATLAGDGEAAALAGPVCESMVNHLARVRGLRVASCRSTGVALAANLDDLALSRLLAINHVLKGEIRSLPAGRLHVRLEMKDVRDGKQHWRLDEEIARADLQALPSRVARAASPVLGEPSVPVRDVMLTAEVYEMHLRATQLSRRPSIEDRREALRLVDRVLAVEPDHVDSLYLRIALRSRLDGYVDGGPADQGGAAQVAAAQAALHRDTQLLGKRLVERDSADRRGRTLLLNAALGQGHWVDAFLHSDALLEHAQQQPGVLRIAARLHLMAGYVRQAQALAYEAVRLDALDAESIEYLATTHGMQGRGAQMRELLSIAAQIGHGGTDFHDAVLAHRRADWPAFERAMTAYALNTQRASDWVPAYVRGVADARAREAAAKLLDAHDEGLRFYMSDYLFEYALLGDVPRSLAAIRRHARQPPKLWLEYLWWPEMSAVRSAQGFDEAMVDIGLVELWNVRGPPDACRRGAGAGWTCR